MTHATTPWVQRYWWYVHERQMIWYRRHVQGLPRPWTEDQVLAANHFTNVYRETDPGTEYIHKILLDRVREEAVWFAVVYRMINRQSTFVAYGDPPFRDAATTWCRWIIERFNQREPVMTCRHLTPSRQMYERAVHQAVDLDVPRQPDKALLSIRSLPGVGSFLGWQILCDLIEAGHVDNDPDLVQVGDGAGFAIAVIAGCRTFDQYLHDGNSSAAFRAAFAAQRRAGFGLIRPTKKDNERYAVWVRWLRDTQPCTFIRWNDQPLDVKNIEHTLCEWCRYERLSLVQA